MTSQSFILVKILFSTPFNETLPHKVRTMSKIEEENSSWRLVKFIFHIFSLKIRLLSPRIELFYLHNMKMRICSPEDKIELYRFNILWS